MLNYWHFDKDRKSGITSFYLDPKDFEQWMKQNNAEYTGNYAAGVLLDNFVVSASRGYAFFYEHYLNAWSSDYLVYFIPYKAGYQHEKAYDQLWAEWLRFEEEAATA